MMDELLLIKGKKKRVHNLETIVQVEVNDNNKV